jgi:DNA-binding response OmpR family regulator
MSYHILCVSYDERLLFTRRMLLEQKGYHITAGLDLVESLAHCGKSDFALLILGHSIPYSDKTKLIRRFRKTSQAPILALWRRRERIVDAVDYIEFSDDPAEFVRAVGVILTRAT